MIFFLVFPGSHYTSDEEILEIKISQKHHKINKQRNWNQYNNSKVETDITDEMAMWLFPTF